MFSNPAPEHDGERATSKPGQTNSPVDSVAPLIISNFLPENRPLNRGRSPRPIPPSTDSLGTEGYMHYLSQKADEDKRVVEQGWNANTTATGPVIGSDW
jgi:hypothetical protein